ncbi:MAG: hypothetical protein FJX75_29250 [Armatimonadetes bacterium]|nr:hypothetical protein [Armatimonadota bacterium]
MDEQEFRAQFVTVHFDMGLGYTLAGLRIPSSIRMPKICVHCGQAISGRPRDQKITGGTEFPSNEPYTRQFEVRKYSFPSCRDCHQGLLSRGKRTPEGFCAPRLNAGAHAVHGIHRDFAEALLEANDDEPLVLLEVWYPTGKRVRGGGGRK